MLLRIKVLNWEKYQARDRSGHKIENPTWFKFHHRVLNSALWGCSPSVTKMAITILVILSESGQSDDTFTTTSRQLRDKAATDRRQTMDILRTLCTIGFLEYQVLTEQSAGKVRAHKNRIEKNREDPNAKTLISENKNPGENFISLPAEVQEQVRKLQKGIRT